MLYAEALAYVDAMLSERVNLKKELRLYKLEQQAKDPAFWQGGFDPTANQAIRNILPARRLYIKPAYSTKPILIEFPEEWLKALDLALKIYAETYGEDCALTVRHHYSYGWTGNEIADKENITVRTFQLRRARFLPLALACCCQAGLVTLEAKADA